MPFYKLSSSSSDNVNSNIDGVLYLRVMDPYKASYGVEDPEFAITQLAQTTMRSEIGKITLDTLFRERENLNMAIVAAINQVSRFPLLPGESTLKNISLQYIVIFQISIINAISNFLKISLLFCIYITFLSHVFLLNVISWKSNIVILKSIAFYSCLSRAFLKGL